MQSKLLVGDGSGLVRAPQALPVIALHQDIEAYLGRYAGLMLYLKEMDETIYGKLCAVRIQALFLLASATDDDNLTGCRSVALITPGILLFYERTPSNPDHFLTGSVPRFSENRGRRSGLRYVHNIS
jgi:hypothetical protein